MNRQKSFAVALALVIAFLVADRLFILPRGALAEETGPQEELSTLTFNPGDVQIAPSKARRVKERLDALHAAEDMAAETLPDAFMVSSPWLAELDPDGALSGRPNRVAAFLKRHQLLAVAGSEAAPSAFIDNRRMVIGQTLDGFTLERIDERSVTFADQALRFELRLQEER